MSNKCQIPNHAQRSIITICLAPQCQGRRVCCSKCLTEFHQNHIDQMVDFNYLNDFLKIQSQKPNETQQNVIKRLQELNDILKEIDNLAKFIKLEIQKLGSLNQLSIWKNLGNRYSFKDQIGNQQWNELTQELISHVQLKEGEIFEKDSLANHLSYSQNMISFQSALKKIVNELMSGTQIFDPKHDILEQNNNQINQNSFDKLTVSHQLKDHTLTITAIDICEEKNLLVSGSMDKTVKLWNLQDSTLLQSYQDIEMVYDVVFSREGNLIAYGGRSNVVNLIEISKKDEKASNLVEHSASVTKLKFTIDTKYLISGSFDDTVIIWEVETKQKLHKLKTGSTVYGLAINRENTLIVSHSETTNIKIWNFKNQNLLCDHKGHKGGAGIQFSNDQQQLISSGLDGKVKIWCLKELNQRKLTLIKEFQVANEMIQTILLTSDSRFLISYCFEDKQVNIIELSTGKQTNSFQMKDKHVSQYPYSVGAVAITEKMDVFAYGQGNQIQVWRKE